jgi:hypothetical protein
VALFLQKKGSKNPGWPFYSRFAKIYPLMNKPVSGEFFQSEPWPCTFKEAYCAYFRCSPECYERNLFRRGLYRRGWALALLIHCFAPGYFGEDMELIREVGEVRDPSLFNYELNVFKGRIQREDKWLKRAWGVRVSGRRIARIRDRILTAPPSVIASRGDGSAQGARGIGIL